MIVKKKFPALAPVLVLIVLSACSGPIETRIESTGEGIPDGAVIAAPVAPPGQSTPEWNIARDSVTAALRASGHDVVEDATLVVDVAVSARPAAAAISTMPGGPYSAAKRQRLLQSCRDQVQRLVVTVADRNSGRLLYRGSAEEYHCKATLSRNLPLLASRAVADARRPGATRTEHRGGVD